MASAVESRASPRRPSSARNGERAIEVEVRAIERRGGGWGGWGDGGGGRGGARLKSAPRTRERDGRVGRGRVIDGWCAIAREQVKEEVEDERSRDGRARGDRSSVAGEARDGSSRRAESSARRSSPSEGDEDGSARGGVRVASALSVLGVDAPRVVGKRTPRKPSSAYVNFEKAAEVLVSLSPQINREVIRAAQNASPARNYVTKDQIAELGASDALTPKRKRARQLFPDEDFALGKGRVDEDTLFGALDGLMTLSENITPQQAEKLKNRRKGDSPRPRGSPARSQLPPLPRYYSLKPLPIPVGKKMLKMNRPRRHVSREIESVGLGAASSLFGDHRLSEMAGPTQDPRSDNRARLLIGAHDPMTRRWANANFFTPATDKSWFEDNGFARWLESIGQGDLRLATREKWREIRRKLPKTRRLSLKFLKDERVDLEYCRHAAREMTALKLEGKAVTEEMQAKMLEWTGGVRVAPPLEVGQTVLAVHPRFRSPYIGNILIVEHTHCRVQFARPELGVEIVRDIDIMPVDVTPEEMELIAAGTAEQVENEAFNAGFRGVLDPAPAVGGVPAYGAGLAIAAQMRDIDVRLLSEAHQALERKRELVEALRKKNDAAEEFKKKPERVKQAAETNGEALKFQREYAAIVLGLRDANTELEAALVRLRQQQGYHDKPLALWRKIKGQNFSDGHRNLSRFAPPTLTPSSDELYAATAEDIVATAGMGARRIVYHVQTTTGAGSASTVTLNPSLQEPLGASTSRDELVDATATTADADAEKVKVTQLITAIVQATLTIKACADHGASPSVLDACLRRVSDSLRPVAVSNRGAYDALEAALRDLRDVLIVR